MSIETYKTPGLSDSDWQQIAKGFSKSFDRKKDKQEFLNYYQRNEFGYSYHAVARNRDNKIYGYTSVVPFYYTIDGETVKIGLSGGSFVLEKYRSDIFIFKKMYDKLKESCSTDNLIGIVGVPNSNSFQYTIKILKKKHLRDLNYYVLPVAPHSSLSNNAVIKTGLSFIARLFAGANKLVSRLFNFKEEKKSVKLVESESFLESRLDEKYVKLRHKDMSGAYRMYDEDGRNVAYIMRFSEEGRRTYRALSYLVQEIIKRENPDLVFHIGTLDLRQFLLFKIPERFEPKKLPLTITFLENCTDKYKESLLSVDEWDFGLINFDVR